MRFRKLIAIGIGSLIGLHLTTGGASTRQKIAEVESEQVATDGEPIAAPSDAPDAEEPSLLHAHR
ncbi:MAG: hypothetical protein L0Y42_00110 [Phycisphaerales bacterium]|nr:hypothetical protein [Phycisphaerales bacterium]